MKIFLFSIILFFAFACKSKEPIAESEYIDSLIKKHTPSNYAITNSTDLEFWKSRLENHPENFVNKQKYAQALAARFHIYGDISDLKKADSLMQNLNRQYREPGFLLSLAAYNILQHRFSEASQLVNSVVNMKAERYATEMMQFDILFEQARFPQASAILRKNSAPRDYNYNFRLSRQDHYQGKLDSAIAHMLKAADLAYSNPFLKQAALSNAADLYIHSGEIKKAADLYKKCIQINSCDFHSIMGLGWIALVHDKNDSLAITVFEFLKKQIRSPDALFKLYQATELRNPKQSKKYAIDFVDRASSPSYGNMYNKYLIHLYTGILDQPSKAIDLAKREVTHRPTPQTYSWLAWSYFKNNQKEEAWKTYKQYVSGHPLETNELYYMGKMMKGLDRKYNAKEFFEAAKENLYDLSPAMAEDLIMR